MASQFQPSVDTDDHHPAGDPSNLATAQTIQSDASSVALDIPQHDSARDFKQKSSSDKLQNDATPNFGQKTSPDAPQDDSTRSHQQNSGPGVPVDQLNQSSSALLARSTSQEIESSLSLGIRKTPSRAVFNDLNTAYLSITSRSTRSRSQNALDTVPDVDGEEGSIPLQELLPPKLPDNLHQILPLPEVPDLASRYDSKSTSSQTALNKYSEHPTTQSVHQDLSIKLAQDRAVDETTGIVPDTTTKSCSSSRGEKLGDFTPQLLQPHMNCGSHDQTQEPLHLRGYDTAPYEAQPSLPHQYPGLETKFSPRPSAPSGSTVGNIYQHYADSSAFDGDTDNDLQTPNPVANNLSSNNDMSLSSRSDGRLKVSALDVRKQRRMDKLMASPRNEPPSYPLPAFPLSAQNHFPSNGSGSLWQSTSYGDTRNLLEVTQQPNPTHPKTTLSRSEGVFDLRLEHVVSDLEETPESSIPVFNSNNPFQVGSQAPAVISQSTDNDCVYDDSPASVGLPDDMVPLEREVSRALRRASGFSAFSLVSASSSFLRFEGSKSNARTPKSKKLLRNKNTASPGFRHAYKRIRKTGSKQSFYNRITIQKERLITTKPNSIRVLTTRNGLFPISQHITCLERNDVAAGPKGRKRANILEGDVNDWETENGSVNGKFEVSTIHQTGSSIANTSHDGMSFHDLELDDYGSTDRITQFAGPIPYSSDYRQQDLKKTRTPVFTPVYREHKVNGYLSGSNQRRAPSDPYNHVPRPLEIIHRNPFTGPPPEVLPDMIARRKLLQKHAHRSRRPNHFPPSVKSSNAIEEQNMTAQGMPVVSAITPANLAAHERELQRLDHERMRLDQDRMRLDREQTLQQPDRAAQPSTPGPTHSHTMRQFLSPINPVGRPDRPSFWRYLMTYGRGDRVENNDADGTLDREFSTLAHAGAIPSRLQGEMPTAEFIEMTRYPENARLASPREHNPLVRGPVGAFYQGIARSQQDPTPSSSSNARGRSTRRYSTQRDYPTNALRPLSLRANPPVTPDNFQVTRQPNFSGYGSPFAPPRRLSWQELYTEAQLQVMRNAAETEGFVDVPLEPTTEGSGHSALDESELRDVNGDPRLLVWTRESRSRMDINDRTRIFSNVVLLLCVWCPPLLFLYVTGKLDGLIVWWTRGEIPAMGDKQKKWAGLLLAVWGFIVLMVAILLVLWSLKVI